MAGFGLRAVLAERLTFPGTASTIGVGSLDISAIKRKVSSFFSSLLCLTNFMVVIVSGGNQPADRGTREGQNCVMYSKRNGALGWYNIACNRVLPFVCEDR